LKEAVFSVQLSTFNFQLRAIASHQLPTLNIHPAQLAGNLTAQLSQGGNCRIFPISGKAEDFGYFAGADFSATKGIYVVNAASFIDHAGAFEQVRDGEGGNGIDQAGILGIQQRGESCGAR